MIVVSPNIVVFDWSLVVRIFFLVTFQPPSILPFLICSTAIMIFGKTLLLPRIGLFHFPKKLKYGTNKAENS